MVGDPCVGMNTCATEDRQWGDSSCGLLVNFLEDVAVRPSVWALDPVHTHH